MLLTKAFSSGTLSKQQVYVHGEDEFLDAEEAWLHEEAADEGGQACSDAELIASQRRIIIDIGKQLGRKIMAGNLNLINITLPVVMFEPRSYLQKLADPWVHPVHLEAAAAAACPLKRLKLCVAWFVAGLQHVFSSWRKPFNPVLGETWQAYLPSGSTMCCEQISHHPPVTAFHVEGPCGVFSFDGLSQPEVSFSGGGLRTSARGYRRITFASDAAVIEITYPYYKIGGLLSGVPHGLIKGTATLTDTKHNLTATITFGPVAGATSRLLSRADSFEVVITGPAAAAAAAAAGIADDVNDIIAVPAWVKQAVAKVAAKRAGCSVAVSAAAAATDAPARPATAEATSTAAVAAATTAATTATAAAAAHDALQCREAEVNCKQTDVASTSSRARSSACESACQETAGAVAAAAAEPVSSEEPLLAALFSNRLAKRIYFQRSKSDTRDVRSNIQSRLTAPKREQHGFGSNSNKDGSAGISVNTSKNARRLAQFFVRASSTALRISSSSSSTMCSSNSSSTQSLVKLEHSSSSSSSTGKSSSSGGSRSFLPKSTQSTSSNSYGSGSGKRSSSSSNRLHRVFGPVACFMSSNADSRDASEHDDMIVSSSASSRRSSTGPQERCCGSATPAAAAVEAVAEDLASSFNVVGGSCGESSNHGVQCDATRAEAAKEGGGEEDTGAAAAANCKQFKHAPIAVTAGTAARSNNSSSSSSKPWPPMQPLPPQQQQPEQVAPASPAQRSSRSFTCKQQQVIPRPGNSSAAGSGVQVLAVGNGCWLSHLDFEGQRCWTLVDDQPEIWQPQQQQQQYVLPSDCQNRPDLVALRKGDVKLSQQLKEQMEQQQRRDAKMRPDFQHVDCLA